MLWIKNFVISMWNKMFLFKIYKIRYNCSHFISHIGILLIVFYRRVYNTFIDRILDYIWSSATVIKSLLWLRISLVCILVLQCVTFNLCFGQNLWYVFGTHRALINTISINSNLTINFVGIFFNTIKSFIMPSNT